MARLKRENAAEPKWHEDRQQWQLQIQKDGRRKQFSSSKPGKAGSDECKRKYNRWIANDGSLLNSRLREIYIDYLKDIEQRKGLKSESYIKAESVLRCHVLPVLGHKKISLIYEQDLQELVNNARNTKTGENLSKKMLNNLRGEISLLWKYLKKSGFVDWRPDTIEIPVKAKTKNKSILESNEIVTLLNDRSVDPYVMAWQMMLIYGLRPGEVYGLEWGNVTETKLTIRQSYNDRGVLTPGKNKNAQRTEYLIDPAKEILKRAEIWKKENRILSKLVFPQLNGKPITGKASRNHLSEYCLENGLTEISPYRLRHTFGSMCKAHLTEQQLKLVLGHSPSMDTGVYLHEMKEDHLIVGVTLNDMYSKILIKSAT